MIKRIIFRADGNAIIGFGHFYRLLALAEMLKNEFTCLFVINQPDDNLRKQASAVCHAVIGLQNEYTYQIPDLVSEENQIPFDLVGIVNANDIVVMDGYHFLSEYQSALHREGCVQIFVDDFLNDYPHARMVINHAPGLTVKSRNKNCEFCFGLMYAILRKPFFSSFSSDASDRGKGIYVSLGGGDYHGLTVRVCKGILASGRFSSIHVVSTKQFDTGQMAALELLAKSELINLYQDISAEKIVAIMDKCSFAFVASSNVLVEAYARGLICYTGYTAKNQNLMYHGFVNEGLAMGMGDLLSGTTESIAAGLITSDLSKIKKALHALGSIENFNKIFKKVAGGIA